MERNKMEKGHKRTIRYTVSLSDLKAIVSYAAVVTVEYWNGAVPADNDYADRAFTRIKKLNNKEFVAFSDATTAIELVYFATHGAWEGSIDHPNNKVHFSVRN